MFLELHILQSFAPSNLNRDDTGSPKTCEFGGYRRARISSQAIKRAMRREFECEPLLPAEARGVRTKRIGDTVADLLADRGRDRATSVGVVQAGLRLLNITTKDDGKTEYLLYLGAAEVERLAEFCDARWDDLAIWAAGDKRDKRAKKNAETDRLAKELKVLLDGGKAADVGLFGRMLADLPDGNIDAASQVAHAISTHQVNAEFDYYTAVDDLKPDDTAGADMIGTVEFNAACYYRYANVDIRQLLKNLGGDEELAEVTIRAFLLASRDAIPTGKQNSFAARNAPSFIMAVVRDRGCWSLANAFVSPARSSSERSLVDASIAALDRHWGDLASVYGTPAGTTIALCAIGDPPLTNLASARVPTFDEVVSTTVAAIRPTLAGA